MKTPILSICIPTYNRAPYLEKTLCSLTEDEKFLNTDDVEIIISNNCSTDNTDEICKNFAEKFPNKIKYIRQEESVLPDKHIFKTIEYATGIYCKLNNDTCTFREGVLGDILEFLKNNSQYAGVFFSNFNDKEGIKTCNNLNKFIEDVSYNITWIGSFCIKKGIYNLIPNPLRYMELKLPQVDIWGWVLEHNYQIAIYHGYLFNVNLPSKKGGNYNITEVFGKNYFAILSDYINKNNGISIDNIEKEKFKILKFINYFYFDLDNNFSFVKSGYLNNMLPLYKSKFYFYLYYLKNIFIKFKNLFFKVKKTDTHRKFCILSCVKFNIRRKSAKNTKKDRV